VVQASASAAPHQLNRHHPPSGVRCGNRRWSNFASKIASRWREIVRWRCDCATEQRRRYQEAVSSRSKERFMQVAGRITSRRPENHRRRGDCPSQHSPVLTVQSHRLVQRQPLFVQYRDLKQLKGVLYRSPPFRENDRHQLGFQQHEKSRRSACFRRGRRMSLLVMLFVRRWPARRKHDALLQNVSLHSIRMAAAISALRSFASA